MKKYNPLLLQLFIIGGFIIFLAISFALAKLVYNDYLLQINIDNFEDEIHKLESKANQKPKDVLFYESIEYKDRYAKENLNLLNRGEKLIIIPKENNIVKTEEVDLNKGRYTDLLLLPNKNQWWEYFFGNTLLSPIGNSNPPTHIPSLKERIDKNYES